MTRVELTAAIGLALDTVREHKMRSFLTVLGVIIGTGTIIAVGSIIAGLDGAVTGVIRAFGTNIAIIFKFPIGFQTRTPEMLRRKPITYEDGLAIEERCPAVVSVQSLSDPECVAEAGRRSTSSATREMNCLQRQPGGTEES